MHESTITIQMGMDFQISRPKNEANFNQINAYEMFRNIQTHPILPSLSIVNCAFRHSECKRNHSFAFSYSADSQCRLCILETIDLRHLDSHSISIEFLVFESVILDRRLIQGLFRSVSVVQCLQSPGKLILSNRI
jgi:hypothetical protein